MHNLTVHLPQGDRQIPFESAPLLSVLLRAQGFSVRTPCGGAGVCGRCGVKAAGALSPEPVQGRALVCKTRLIGDAEVWLEDESALRNITLAGLMPQVSLDPMDASYGVAVDIGTTTIAVMLMDLASGQIAATAAAGNPQSAIADNVIGRISAALAGQGDALHHQVLGTISALRNEACSKAGFSQDAIVPSVIAGNTAMLYFYSNLSPLALSAAPFKADDLFGRWADKVYLPRCIGAFLGADLLMAILSSGMCERSETALLADIGTNGEIALWHKGRLLCAAAAAGPAFEGGGISQGMGSVLGAIDSVQAGPDGLMVTTIGGAPARGICGSGLIDAAAALLVTGQMDETGRLADGRAVLAGSVSLDQEDIRQLQLAKGAVAAAMGTLCRTACVTYNQIDRFYLAGGFGAHMNEQSAAAIGLIPETLLDKTVSLGNAALAGAAMLLLNQGLVEQSLALANLAEAVTLSGNPVFADLFMDRMMFEPF